MLAAVYPKHCRCGLRNAACNAFGERADTVYRRERSHRFASAIAQQKRVYRRYSQGLKQVVRRRRAARFRNFREFNAHRFHA